MEVLSLKFLCDSQESKLRRKVWARGRGVESLVHQDSDMKELAHENVENERNRTSVTWEPVEGGRQGKEDTHSR